MGVWSLVLGPEPRNLTPKIGVCSLKFRQPYKLFSPAGLPCSRLCNRYVHFFQAMGFGCQQSGFCQAELQVELDELPVPVGVSNFFSGSRFGRMAGHVTYETI